MPKHFTQLPTCLLAALAMLTSSTALAQEDRWFRVEMLVFTNETAVPPTGAALPEQWNATPVLAYPDASRFLVDLEQVAINAARFEGKSVLDEYGRQIITVLEEPYGPASSWPGETPVSAGTDATGPLDSMSDKTPKPLGPVFEGAPETPVTRGLPRPFVKLPESYQEFRDKAALMQRRGGNAVLFHETWVQPVGAEGSSLPIVLDHSGDMGQWPRLQGSIRIFLSRYLHLETNFWLNTAGDYLPGSWRMPAPPLGPPSLIVEEEFVFDIGAAIESVDAIVTPQPDTVPAAAAMGAAQDGSANEGMADPIIDELAPAAEAEPEGPVYPFRHAVLLDQKRRMRSNELHYLDHPLMGLIIKFTIVSAEQLDEIATAQQRSFGSGQPL